jgi:hypothetical protein
VGDGWRRVLAARLIGLTDIAAEVHAGGQRDALLCSISANSSHGLPRSNADKRKAAGLLLADDEWKEWNDREIARRCQVSNHLVRAMRPQAGTKGGTDRKVRRRGQVYEMNLAPGEPAGRPPLPVSEAERIWENSQIQAQGEQAVTPPTPEPLLATDPQGVPIPQERCQVFGELPLFQEARHLFDRLAKLADRIAQGPSGDLYRPGLVRTLTNGQPAFTCPAAARRPGQAGRRRAVLLLLSQLPGPASGPGQPPVQEVPRSRLDNPHRVRILSRERAATTVATPAIQGQPIVMARRLRCRRI